VEDVDRRPLVGRRLLLGFGHGCSLDAVLVLVL
jgi:hypothetical protein